MNKFIVDPNRKLTPQQMIYGVTGIHPERLINMIRENRDGKFDHLYKMQNPKEVKHNA